MGLRDNASGRHATVCGVGEGIVWMYVQLQPAGGRQHSMGLGDNGSGGQASVCGVSLGIVWAFATAELANTALAFAMASQVERPLFAKLARYWCTVKPQHLANTAWAFATAGLEGERWRGHTS